MNTPQQIVERNMTLYMYSSGYKDTYLKSPDPYMRKLAEMMIETDDVWEYYNLRERFIKRSGNFPTR